MKTARAVVETHYSRLGAIRRFKPVLSPASNQHFVVDTASGRFFLKVIRKPDALYGGDGIERLRDIAAAVVDLGAAGLDIEQLEASDDAGLLVVVRGSVYRLFRFIEGRQFNGKPADLRQAAAALGKFHRLGGPSLRPATRRRVAGFHSPYPLDETIEDIDALQQFIERRLKVRLGGMLRETATRCGALAQSPKVLAHNDFHPGNVLFAKDGSPTVIDLDNLMFAPAGKCAALAVLRFGVRRPADRVADKLHRVFRQMAGPYKKASGIALGPDLYAWMACIELEKILRIAARVRRTGGYAGFLENIAGRHLPNLRFLMANLL